MKKKLKGGIESIIALIIIVGIVVALIIATVIPMARQGKELGDGGTTRISTLKSTIIEG